MATFYKYMPFGPHTRLSLYLLLKEKSLFFADKRVLNDPTDCNPHIIVNSSEKDIIEFAKTLALESDDFLSDVSDVYPQEIIILSKYISGNKKEPDDWLTRLYVNSFTKRHMSKIKDGEAVESLFMREIMDHHINGAKIFSLSRTAVEPRMWAHYADSHRGICIEIEIGGQIDNRYGDVEYTTKRPTIFSSEIISSILNGDNPIKDHVYHKMFLTKSDGWGYERESRIYIASTEYKKSAAILDFPEGAYISPKT